MAYIQTIPNVYLPCKHPPCSMGTAMVMSTTTEMADMHLIFSASDGNGWEATCLYTDSFQGTVSCVIPHLQLLTSGCMWLVQWGPCSMPESECLILWIWNQGPAPRHTQSPDFRSLNCFLWSHLKSNVYKTAAKHEDLQTQNEAACDRIWNTPGIFDRMRQSLSHNQLYTEVEEWQFQKLL
jgi:hypothetical protein